ncbi:hypothetical protein [Segatella copri]|nr:hypothetical protein [Segatella copri]MCW4146742.1 hypothetical protein [Segatella copri]
MEYNILIETDFFNLLNAGHKNKGGNALENSYREFIRGCNLNCVKACS